MRGAGPVVGPLCPHLAGSPRAGYLRVPTMAQGKALLLTLPVVPVAYSYLAELEGVPWTEVLGGAWTWLRTYLARRFGLF